MSETFMIEVARLPHTAWGFTSQFGRSYCYIKCPFCGTTVKAYVWSLAGGGKRCTNKDCRAMHTSFNQSVSNKIVKPII